MCRSDIDQRAEGPLVRLLDQIAVVLAREAGVPREAVQIGPVDFGTEESL